MAMRFTVLTTVLLMMLIRGSQFPASSTGMQSVGLDGREVVPLDLDTGRYGNSGPVQTVVYTTTLSSPRRDTAWIRLHFDEVNLGQGSRMKITSLQDGDTQMLDAGTMQLWSNSSAMFVGDKVELQLYVAPGDVGIGARVTALTVGGAHSLRALDKLDAPNAPETQCGLTDDRVASADPRIGRLNGNCTAWLASNGAMLTAGHCVNFDPDDFPGGSGPGLPDNIPDINDTTIVEFDVPPSSVAGVIALAQVANQYPVSATGYLRWRFDGTGQGLGKDWAVFRLGRNTTTGADAATTRGYFRMRSMTPPNGTTVRISGYGTDLGAANQTLQTHTGLLTQRVASGPDNADIRFDYQVDAMPGNSGSPIIREGIGLGDAIGIHTNGGCGANSVGGVTGANSGTSFEVTALQDAINRFPTGLDNIRHVDADPGTFTFDPETGHVFAPFHTLQEGIDSAPSGGWVSLVAGNYYVSTSRTIDKSVVLVAPAGLVVIR